MNNFKNAQYIIDVIKGMKLAIKLKDKEIYDHESTIIEEFTKTQNVTQKLVSNESQQLPKQLKSTFLDYAGNEKVIKAKERITILQAEKHACIKMIERSKNELSQILRQLKQENTSKFNKNMYITFLYSLKGLTQSEIAEKMDMCERQIQRYYRRFKND